MTLEQVTCIINEHFDDDDLLDRFDRWDILCFACEEIARQAGIHFTKYDPIVDLLIEKLPAFADWMDACEYI